MDRAERKRRTREVTAWAARKTFVQREIIEGNYAAYAVGVGHALDAAATLWGLGEVRLQRFREKLQLVQQADGIGPDAPVKEERRQSAAAFDKTYQFDKRTAGRMNVESYAVAIDHITDAIGIIYELGQKRMEEFQATLAAIQVEDGYTDFLQDGNPHALRLRRADRFNATAMISDQAKKAICSLITT